MGVEDEDRRAAKRRRPLLSVILSAIAGLGSIGLTIFDASERQAAFHLAIGAIFLVSSGFTAWQVRSGRFESGLEGGPWWRVWPPDG